MGKPAAVLIWKSTSASSVMILTVGSNGSEPNERVTVKQLQELCRIVKKKDVCGGATIRALEKVKSVSP